MRILVLLLWCVGCSGGDPQTCLTDPSRCNPAACDSIGAQGSRCDKPGLVCIGKENLSESTCVGPENQWLTCGDGKGAACSPSAPAPTAAAEGSLCCPNDYRTISSPWEASCCVGGVACTCTDHHLHCAGSCNTCQARQYRWVCGTDCPPGELDPRCAKGQWTVGEACGFAGYECETSYGRFACGCDGTIHCATTTKDVCER